MDRQGIALNQLSCARRGRAWYIFNTLAWRCLDIISNYFSNARGVPYLALVATLRRQNEPLFANHIQGSPLPWLIHKCKILCKGESVSIHCMWGYASLVPWPSHVYQCTREELGRRGWLSWRNGCGLRWCVLVCMSVEQQWQILKCKVCLSLPQYSYCTCRMFHIDHSSSDMNLPSMVVVWRRSATPDNGHVWGS